MRCDSYPFKISHRQFHESWVHGTNHRDGSIHLCSMPMPNFWEAFYWRKSSAQCAKDWHRVQNSLWNGPLICNSFVAAQSDFRSARKILLNLWHFYYGTTKLQGLMPKHVKLCLAVLLKSIHLDFRGARMVEWSNSSV